MVAMTSICNDVPGPDSACLEQMLLTIMIWHLLNLVCGMCCILQMQQRTGHTQQLPTVDLDRAVGRHKSIRLLLVQFFCFSRGQRITQRCCRSRHAFLLVKLRPNVGNVVRNRLSKVESRLAQAAMQKKRRERPGFVDCFQRTCRAQLHGVPCTASRCRRRHARQS